MSETPYNRRLLQEQVLTMASALHDRRQTDPLQLFEPHPKQQLFIDSALHGHNHQNWLIAANRSGKSDAGAYVGSTLARYGNPKAKPNLSKDAIVKKDRATSGWVSALDFPLSRDSIQPKYFDNGYVPPNAPHGPFIPDREIQRWDKEAQILTLRNGSIIGFKSADSGRSKYQAVEKDWVHMDEEHPKDIYEEIVIRIGANPLNFFCTATIIPPEGQRGGVSWIYSDIISPYQEGRLKGIGLFGASIYDNPHIPREEIAFLETLYPPGSPQARIRLGGEYLPGMQGARAYTSFDRRLHVKKAPILQPRRPLCWTWDFNVEPLVSIVGQRIGPVFWFIDEIVLEEGSIPEMCEAFYNKRYPHYGEVHLYGDATSQGRRAQTRRTDFQLILNEMRQYGTPIRMKVPSVNPPIGDRINAMNRSFKTEENEINVFVDPQCQELIKDFDQVLLDKQGKIKKTSNRRDSYFKRTHTSDAAGYWIAYEAPVTARAFGVQKQRTRIRTPGYSFGR